MSALPIILQYKVTLTLSWSPSVASECLYILYFPVPASYLNKKKLWIKRNTWDTNNLTLTHIYISKAHQFINMHFFLLIVKHFNCPLLIDIPEKKLHDEEFWLTFLLIYSFNNCVRHTFCFNNQTIKQRMLNNIKVKH